MQIITAIGKESSFDIGYKIDPECFDSKFICLIIFDIFWNRKTKRWGFGFGIPFIFGIGFIF